MVVVTLWNNRTITKYPGVLFIIPELQLVLSLPVAVLMIRNRSENLDTFSLYGFSIFPGRKILHLFLTLQFFHVYEFSRDSIDFNLYKTQASLYSLYLSNQTVSVSEQFFIQRFEKEAF